jgi:hemerythrin-like metal-binding protein
VHLVEDATREVVPTSMKRGGSMVPSAPLLGVPFMDHDHAAIDRLFDAAATTADSELRALFDRIARELHDHFAREEAEMARAQVPFLLRHFELHTQLLREVENMRREVARSGVDCARQLIGVLLLRFVADHVATADAAAARFLTGRTKEEAFASQSIPSRNPDQRSRGQPL